MAEYRRYRGPFHTAPAHPSGKILLRICQDELDADSAASVDSATITNCNYVASYSWIRSEQPTMMIPGKPPAWTAPADTPTLFEDIGQYFCDPNAARFPSYPLEPAVRAVLTQDTALATTDVDVFACGSTLSSLRRFASEMDGPFRFDVQLVGETIFLLRTERSPIEFRRGVVGYGNNFLRRYTTLEDDVEGAESHQRIITYDFGGLKLAVRSEIDAYISNNEILPAKTPKDRVQIASGALQVREGGAIIPQASIVDIKTRSLRQCISMADFYPSLWLKQIPSLIIGRHEQGHFSDLEYKDVVGGVRDWERSQHYELQRLAYLLKKVVEFLKGTEAVRLVVYRPPSGEGHEGEDELQILLPKYKSGVDVLPEELKTLWRQRSCEKQTSGDAAAEESMQGVEEDTFEGGVHVGKSPVP